jgi:ABC-type nitrate/sulfonate/bicarbonate transport system substrate-binding protein
MASGVGAKVLAPALIVFALGLGPGTAATQPSQPKLDNVTLQLRSVAQAEFAGYYAAKALGFYRAFGLNVDIRPGGSDVTPEQVVASGRAQIGVDWLPVVLASRDTGAALVNIAQVFARSGMAEVAWRSSGIGSIAGLKNKTVGVWCCGNQFELYAALKKYGIEAADSKGIKIFNQPFDMRAFLHHRIDAAAALTYNQLAQVLEATNPVTGSSTLSTTFGSSSSRTRAPAPSKMAYLPKKLGSTPTGKSRCGSSLHRTGAGSSVAPTSRPVQISCFATRLHYGRTTRGGS